MGLQVDNFATSSKNQDEKIKFVLLLRVGMFALACTFDNTRLTILSQRGKYISMWQSTVHMFQNVTNITNISVEKIGSLGVKYLGKQACLPKQAILGKMCKNNAKTLQYEKLTFLTESCQNLVSINTFYSSCAPIRFYVPV